MADDSTITPRTAISKFIEADPHNLDETVRITRPRSKNESLNTSRRQAAGNISKLEARTTKGRRNAPLFRKDEDLTTPKSSILGFIGSQESEQTVRVQTRVKSSVKTPLSPRRTNRRRSQKGNLLREATERTLRQNTTFGEQRPTPRTTISTIIDEADDETPVVPTRHRPVEAIEDQPNEYDDDLELEHSQERNLSQSGFQDAYVAFTDSQSRRNRSYLRVRPQIHRLPTSVTLDESSILQSSHEGQRSQLGRISEGVDQENIVSPEKSELVGRSKQAIAQASGNVRHVGPKRWETDESSADNSVSLSMERTGEHLVTSGGDRRDSRRRKSAQNRTETITAEPQEEAELADADIDAEENMDVEEEEGGGGETRANILETGAELPERDSDANSESDHLPVGVEASNYLQVREKNRSRRSSTTNLQDEDVFRTPGSSAKRRKTVENRTPSSTLRDYQHRRLSKPLLKDVSNLADREEDIEAGSDEGDVEEEGQTGKVDTHVTDDSFVHESAPEDETDVQDGLPGFNSTFSRAEEGQSRLIQTTLDGFGRMVTPVMPRPSARTAVSTPQVPPLKGTPLITPGPSSQQTKKRVPAKPNKKTENATKAKRATKKDDVPLRLPRINTASIFRHFISGSVSKDVLDEVEKTADKFWAQTVDDLSCYAKHSGRRTVNASDVELLMKRQRFVDDKKTLVGYIEKYLPLEQQQKLIQVATSGNVLVPKK